MLATQILALQLVLGLIVLLSLGALVMTSVRESEHERAIDQARGVTAALATSPWVLEAVTGPDPAGALGAAVERTRTAAGVDFVVVMSPEGVRYTHPDPTQVGGTFIGDITGASAGRTTVEDAVGTLGPSVRVVSPIVDDDGEIVALVSTGVVLRTVSARAQDTLIGLSVIAALVAVVAVIGTVLIAGSVRRATFGLGPQGLARLHSFQDAVLHSVRAGLVLVDREGRVVLANDEARRLLDTEDLVTGIRTAQIDVGDDLGELLSSGRLTEGEVHTAGGRAVVVTQVEATRDGRTLGTVATIRDRTDLARLSGELDNLQQFTASLRARAHEADNRLHTVAMLVELGRTQEALEYAGSISSHSQALVDAVTEHVHDTTVAALLLGKAAQADERGLRFTLGPELEVPQHAVASHELVTVLGNLLDNAMDAALEGVGVPVPPPDEGAPDDAAQDDDAPWIHLAGGLVDGYLELEVSDSGAGVAPEVRESLFESGVSTKPCPEDLGGRGVGLALAAAAAARLDGELVLLDTAITTFRFTTPLRPTRSVPR